MADEPNKFTHIGIEKKTHKQIAILAKVHGCNIYDLVGTWTQSAWEIALQAGLVTEAMLETQKAHVVGNKTTVKLDEWDKKKLLEKVKRSAVSDQPLAFSNQPKEKKVKE